MAHKKEDDFIPVMHIKSDNTRNENVNSRIDSMILLNGMESTEIASEELRWKLFEYRSDEPYKQLKQRKTTQMTTTIARTHEQKKAKYEEEKVNE